MLSYLGIHQISLVENARLDFSACLNVLSGESGAGKSVVLDALGFVAGATRSRCQLRAGASGGHVEALFSIGEEERPALWALLEPLELPLEDELVLCRRLDANGRSRCFVQGRLVPLRTLAEISAVLVEFSDQGDSHALRSPAAQLRLLDACAGLEAESAALGSQYEKYRATAAQCRAQQARADEAERRRDFLEFQLAELDACRISEFADAEARLDAVADTRAAHDFCEGLESETVGTDNSLVERLEAWDRRLARVPLAVESGLGDALSEARESLHRLGQLAARLREANETPQKELAELEILVERIHDLARKHRVQPSELEARAARLREELDQALRAEALRRELEHAEKHEHTRTLELAALLHAARRRAATKLGSRAEGALEALGLPGARLSLQLSEVPLGPQGTTAVDAAFAGHPGAEPRSLGRVASGGELGRVLLALRLASGSRRPLLVLDEIDAGAGGRAASQIGESLARAATLGQILCVTHWPQVACRADTHWVAIKHASEAGTRTELSQVEGEPQLGELCRMLGGEAETGRAHALALMAVARAQKTALEKAARTEKATLLEKEKARATPKRRKLRLMPSAA